MIQSAAKVLAYAAGKQLGASAVHNLVDVKSLRDKLGLPQPVFAARFGLSVGTLRDWEQGRAMLGGLAQVLFRFTRRLRNSWRGAWATCLNKRHQRADRNRTARA